MKLISESLNEFLGRKRPAKDILAKERGPLEQGRFAKDKSVDDFKSEDEVEEYFAKFYDEYTMNAKRRNPSNKPELIENWLYKNAEKHLANIGSSWHYHGSPANYWFAKDVEKF